RLTEFGVAGPLLDMPKLDDISADFVASLPGAEIVDRVLPWALEHDKAVAAALGAQHDLALRALAVEREGVDNPRKDLRRWADFGRVYGYFFPEMFELVTDSGDARLGGLAPDLVRALATGFAAAYVEPGPGVVWFEQIRTLADAL